MKGTDNWRRDNKNNISEREMRKTKKEKQTKAERSKGTRSYSERVRA